MQAMQAMQAMQRFLVVFLLFSGLNGFAQNTIEGTIAGYGGKMVYLRSIYGEKAQAIDSTMTDPGGRLKFTLVNRLPGMYRVQWSKESMVDLIWNQEDVKFTTTRENPEDSLQILESRENKISRAYSALDHTNQAKIQLLVPILDFYPEIDAFYSSVAREFEQLQTTQQKFVDSIASLYPGSFAVRLAKMYQAPFIPAVLGNDQRVEFLRQHYFDRIDFSDTALLRSTVFANKAMAYLSLYSNNRLPQKQLEAEFIKAVTRMLGAASVNPVIYKFWLDYLVGGFDKYHFDDVITYIADNFQDPSSCEDQERKSALQKKLDTFKKIAIGKIAPDLEVPDSSGIPVKLSAIDAEFTLVMFYSTTCPHCVSMTPRLKELYDKQQPKRFEVLSVSIDTGRPEWTEFIREQKLTWINVSELKGFNGKSADDYNIYATPTMFLLDRQKTILAKPVSLMELEQTLRDYNLVN
jgi:peroxiredoxin